ncbi:hypothetical protein T492DRAFT_1079893, partial [Pavlovales sp. CCMP2436]
TLARVARRGHGDGDCAAAADGEPEPGTSYNASDLSAARAVHLAEGPRRGPPRRGLAARTTQGGKTAALLPPTANRRQTLRPERCAVPAALAAAWPRCHAPGAASSSAHLRPTRRVHLAHRSGRSRASLRLLAPLWGCSRVDALDTRPGRRLCPPPT